MSSTPSPFRIEAIAMLRLATPLAAANLLQMAVYAIDVMFVARLGQDALAVSSLAVSLFGLMVWTLSGLTGAVAPLMAAELGRRRHSVRDVRRSVRMVLWLTVITGLLGMGIASFGEQILLAAGQQPVVAARAGAFLKILRWAVLPMEACSVLRIVLSTLGRPGYATAITALSIGVNALGNYALVFGHFGLPALGLTGSGLSSTMTAWIGVLAYLALLFADRRLRRYRLLGRWWRWDGARMRDLLRIGLPGGVAVLAEGGLFSAAALLMGRIGEVELAAHTVALQVASLTFQIPLGISQAAAIRVGFHFGAGDKAAVSRAGWAALATGALFALMNAGAMWIAPRLIASAYVDVNAPANAAMVTLALHYMAIAAAFQLADGLQTVGSGVLKGLQDTRVPLLFALMGYWPAGLGTAAVLGLFTPLRGTGVWLGLAVGLMVVAALMVTRWCRRERLGLLGA